MVRRIFKERTHKNRLRIGVHVIGHVFIFESIYRNCTIEAYPSYGGFATASLYWSISQSLRLPMYHRRLCIENRPLRAASRRELPRCVQLLIPGRFKYDDSFGLVAFISTAA